MTTGEKIKKARLGKGLTQAALCRNKITRNMLSAIESGKARPSLGTAEYLAERLELPVSYLLSEDVDLFLLKKQKNIDRIRIYLKEKSYAACVELSLSLGDTDDEIALVLATCYFELGKRAVLNGSLQSGKQHLASSLKYAKMTAYDTVRIRHCALLYSALADNIKAPLLVMDIKAFGKYLATDFEEELFSYISLDASYPYGDERLSAHIKAKELIKDRRYYEALSILKSIEEERSQGGYNAYLIFGIYTDMENCYKQIADFESAYRYANKRLSLIEGFKS